MLFALMIALSSPSTILSGADRYMAELESYFWQDTTVAEFDVAFRSKIRSMNPVEASCQQSPVFCLSFSILVCPTRV
ncbi:hypothetical protein F4805DRAFT_427288 [Annulohypoxylon moriforme]|nr:hypothetical protein F4805DRAFT_427288 [Annulohypoxylon moriforme]